MTQEYLCPWGGISKFNYNLPFYDLVAEMTKAFVASLMKDKGIANSEIMDAAIGEVTINFPKDLKYWRPFFDLKSFVYLRSKYYLRQELDKNNAFEKRFKSPKDTDNFSSMDTNRKISYKTVSRFEKVDAAKIGAYAYYLGEGCK